jgi:hypothetical protein
MNKGMSHRKIAANINRILCGSLFVAFSFCYLYKLQCDILTTAQYVLSHGKTVYSPFWGATIITLAFLLLQTLVQRFFHFRSSYYALSFFPSMLLLLMLTHFNQGIFQGFVFSMHAFWMMFLSLPVALILCWGIRTSQRGGGLNLYSMLCTNLTAMLVFLSFFMSQANTDELFHYNSHVERLLIEGKWDEALQVGRHSSVTGRELTAMRAFAMNRTQRMGDELFCYPQCYGSKALLPQWGDTAVMFFDIKPIYVSLGALPSGHRFRVNGFVEQVLKLDTLQTNRRAADYALCASLLDRHLDKFAEILPRYYTINDSLPRHYKEALVLYNQIAEKPLVAYEDETLQEQLTGMHIMEDTLHTAHRRYNLTRESYGDTYWWYYYYQKEQ